MKSLVLSLLFAAPAEFFVADVEGDRVLLARPIPAPPNTDVPLRVETRYLERGAAVPSPLASETLSFARLLPGGRFVAVRANGELVEVRDGAVTVLDRDVVGAVGASADGAHLVYCKGEAPALEVWRHDAGGSRPVTTDMAPAWSPATDGRAVVFVSARAGAPALWRVDGAGAPRQLTNVGVTFAPGRPPPTLEPFPDSMGPPLLAGGLLVFESTGAVHVLSDAGRPLRVLPGAASPHWITPGRVIGVVAGGRRVAVEVAP